MVGGGAALVCFLFGTAVLAADSPVSSASDGRTLGIVCGLALTGLVAYAMYLYMRPLLREGNSGLWWAVLLLLAVAMLKIATVPMFPGLGIDVGTYQAWALRMADVGPARTYEAGYFLDYPPGYLYALWAASSLARAVGADGDGLRLIVETAPLIADFLLGFLIFAMVRRSKRPHLAWAGTLLFALNPGLLFDTLAWGQSDSVPALLMFLSMLMVADSEYEIGWGLAAFAVLVKPQALMLLPVLGLWTLLKANVGQWMRSAAAFLAVALLGIAPFQIGHPWSWIFSLYSSTAAYYHETSVNAFNFMALIGGLRQADSTTLVGVSYFTIGMSLLALLFAWIGYLVWRKPSPERLNLGILLALFGSFMFAPRMHERYLYPALVFLIPLVLETPILGIVLGALTLTFLLNLADVMWILETKPVTFFAPHDTAAMIISAVNLLAFAALVPYAMGAGFFERATFGKAWRKLSWRNEQAVTTEPQDPVAPPWLRADTIIIASLIVIAAAIRFWRLWFPAEIVFDEVHFVGQARHYLNGHPFLDPHPPLAKLLIALSIRIFGDHSWAWRVPNAIAGTGLVAITYLLGRRLFGSRFAAMLAAAFVLSDGMFLVDSRIAVLDIVYVTCAAWTYLLLFRFIQAGDLMERRRILLAMGVVLGLCLSAKLYIPVVTFLLVVGVMCFVLMRRPRSTLADKNVRSWSDALRERRIRGALALVGGVSAIVYVGVFLPHFWLGWWGGIADLFHYYSKVVWYEKSVSTATHPYSSPWWSWPLLLRPIAYWQNFPAKGDIVATIWGGGNPALWWGALTAIWIVALQAIERRSLSRAFITIGYLGYLIIWIPIGRTLFLYHYMPSEYFGFLALAAVLYECWEGRTQFWEQAAMLLTLAPVFFLGLGPALGVPGFAVILAGWAAMWWRGNNPGKWLCVSFLAVALVLFVYFFPVWTGFSIQRAGYYARMWLQGPGLRNWI